MAGTMHGPTSCRLCSSAAPALLTRNQNKGPLHLQGQGPHLGSACSGGDSTQVEAMTPSMRSPPGQPA
eukprot:271071-Lingulodinium_polyedra.AAC.1